MEIEDVEDINNKFTETVVFEVALSARYFKMLATQIFQKYNIDISVDDFGVLDFLSYNEELCQRDLAKIILKDRASMGKILTSLEKRGFIERFVDTKNNRLVKKLKLTESGRLFVIENNLKLQDIKQKIEEALSREDLATLKNILKNTRKRLGTMIETQI
jgi:DNA-binding MarR family transcriptional regulator